MLEKTELNVPASKLTFVTLTTCDAPLHCFPCATSRSATKPSRFTVRTNTIFEHRTRQQHNMESKLSAWAAARFRVPVAWLCVSGAWAPVGECRRQCPCSCWCVWCVCRGRLCCACGACVRAAVTEGADRVGCCCFALSCAGGLAVCLRCLGSSR